MTNEELKEWKRHPLTEEVFKLLNKTLEDLKTEAIELAGVEGSKHRLAQLNGRYEGIKDVIDMEVD